MKPKFAVSLLGLLLLATLVRLTLARPSALAQNQPARNSAADRQKPLVLRGGLLIDGKGGPPLANSVVVISGDKIQSVGAEGSVTIPVGAEVIDASGKTIMPGLFDSHVHLRNFQASSYLYWGVTSVGDLANQQGFLLAYRDAIEKGRMIGPHLMMAGARFNYPLLRDANGKLIAGQPVIRGDIIGWGESEQANGEATYVWDKASAEKAVAEHKQLGLDVIKLFTRIDPALMKITIQAAHEAGIPVFAHYTSGESREGLFTGTDEILDTGLDVHVHMYGLIKATAPKQIVDRIAHGENLTNQAWSQLDTSKYPPLIQKMVQVKMFLNPTLDTEFGNATKFREVFDHINTEYVNGPIVAGLPEATRQKFASAFKAPRRANAVNAANGGNAEGAGGAGSAGAANLVEGYKRVGLFVKEFADAGGKVIAGSDTSGRELTPGLQLQEELQMLHEIGLTPMQVIQAATSWAMEAWGKSNVVGTLESGKRADILILNRNPLDDMMATTDIYKVIWSGSVVEREGLANWHDTIPKPELVDNGVPNPFIHLPLISRISPELVSTNAKAGSEMTITGENFSKESLVLMSDRLLPVKSEWENHDKSAGAYGLTVSIPEALLRKPGTYPIVVVTPGSQGAVSNTHFLFVEAP